MNRERPSAEAVSIVLDVGALVRPDLSVVDLLVRIQLAAGRAGGRLELGGACSELCDLIELLGLADVLPLRIEAGGQTEQREQPPGVEEEGDPGDPLL